MTRPDDSPHHPADDPRVTPDVTEQLAEGAGDTAVEYPHSDEVDVPPQVAKDAGEFAVEHPVDTVDEHTRGVSATGQLAKDAGDTAVEYPHSDHTDVPEQLAKDAGDHL